MKHIILFIYLLSVCGTTAQEMNTSPSMEMGERIDEYMKRCEPFGFSGALMVAKDGKILVNNGYGYANRKTGKMNDKNSVFSTGSVTKQFTAAAILKLEMMGKVSTDDGLDKYFTIPEDKKGITLHHLLTHTSGLPLAFSGDDFQKMDREEYLKRTFGSKLAFAPGERFKYSNVGYVLLALILEKQSGMSYEEFLNKHLFTPSGMTRTGYKIPEWNDENFVHIYNGDKENGTTAMFTEPTIHLLGNGGILSTTGDMFLWMESLKEYKVLSEEATVKLFTPFRNQYAYGWDSIDDGNLRQHNGGSSLGCGAELRWFVEEDLVTMIFTNATIDGDIGFNVVRNELEAMTMGDEVPMPPKVQKVDKDLSSFVGQYRFPSGNSFHIKGDNTSANLIVENQELLDFILDPEGYRAGGTNVGLNEKFRAAFEKAFNENDYSGFQFTDNVDELKFEIQNEIKLEGIRNPKFKVVRTMPSSYRKDSKVTLVAINESPDFDSESLMLQIVTENEKYVGMGVDFGFLSPIKLNLAPIANDTFQAYGLASKIGAKIQLKPVGKTGFLMTNKGQAVELQKD